MQRIEVDLEGGKHHLFGMVSFLLRRDPFKKHGLLNGLDDIA